MSRQGDDNLQRIHEEGAFFKTSLGYVSHSTPHYLLQQTLGYFREGSVH